MDGGRPRFTFHVLNAFNEIHILSVVVCQRQPQTSYSRNQASAGVQCA